MARLHFKFDFECTINWCSKYKFSEDLIPERLEITLHRRRKRNWRSKIPFVA